MNTIDEAVLDVREKQTVPQLRGRLNDAIKSDDIARVLSCLAQGAPVLGWDIEIERETGKRVYDDKIPAPLAVAAQYASPSVVRLLIEKGAPTWHGRLPDGHNPAIAAVIGNRPDNLAEILKHGAVFSYDETTELLSSPAWQCVRGTGSPDVLKYLLGQPRFRAEAEETYDDLSILHFAARRFNEISGKRLEATDKKIIETLIGAGFDPNLQTKKHGKTMLHEIAGRIGRDTERMFELAVWLMSLGANPDIKNDKGKTFIDAMKVVSSEAKSKLVSDLQAFRIREEYDNENARTRKTVKSI